MMNGKTNYILLITFLIYCSRAPAQNVKQENDSVKMNKPFNMDIRTNIIYDALLIPNVGMEFDLGRRWTVAANAMYGWWNNDRSHWYWRAYGGDVALRKWLGKAARRKALTGHHVGVYGQIFTYDFETGGRGYMGGKPGGTLWDKMNYVVGAEYGYSLPIARRWNIDLDRKSVV